MGGSFVSDASKQKHDKKRSTEHGDDRNHGSNGNSRGLRGCGTGRKRQQRDYGGIATMNATDRANLWKHNRAIVDEWMDDYGKRTGKSNDEIIAERQALWIHDERARKVGSWEGYEMSVCPMSSNQYRYTVVTPWGMNEGLCDLERRDDYAAAQTLFATIAAM